MSVITLIASSFKYNNCFPLFRPTSKITYQEPPGEARQRAASRQIYVPEIPHANVKRLSETRGEAG